MEDLIKGALKRYQIFILPALAGMIALAILGFVIIPEALQIPDGYKAIQTVQDKLDSLKKKQNTLDSVDENQYNDYTNDALVAIPENKNISDLLNDLFFLLQSNNLKINGFAFSLTNKPEKGVSTYTTDIDVLGNPQDILKFISDTKKIPRVSKVSQLSLSTGSSKGVEITMQIMLYYQKLPTTSVNSDTPVSLPQQSMLDKLNALKDQITQFQSQLPQATSSAVIGKPDPFQ